MPPFVMRKLIHIYHGLFCFKIPGARCGPDEYRWSRERGQEETLQLGASTHGLAVGYSRKHRYSDKIEYLLRPYGSLTPVWCHDDSELHVYETTSLFTPWRFRREVKTFCEADPGYFFGNYVNPDPECLRGNPALPNPPAGLGPSPPEMRGLEGARIGQLVEPLSFSREESDEQPEALDAAAAAAAQMLSDDLLPAVEPVDSLEDDWYSPGLVGLDHSVTWLVDARPTREQPEDLVVASAGRLARARGFVSVSERERSFPIPVLAFGGNTDAARGELSVIAEGEGESGEMWSGSAAVREDEVNLPGLTSPVVLTTLWGHADLRSLPAGVGGSVQGRLYNAADDLIAQLRLPFWIEEEPERLSDLLISEGSGEATAYAS